MALVTRTHKIADCKEVDARLKRCVVIPQGSFVSLGLTVGDFLAHILGCLQTCTLESAPFEGRGQAQAEAAGALTSALRVRVRLIY
eukprot:3839052-Rhodomonas_salina.2